MAVAVSPMLNHGTNLYVTDSDVLIGTEGEAIHGHTEHPHVSGFVGKTKEEIERDIIVPILESENLADTFREKREGFVGWRAASAEARVAEAVSMGLDTTALIASEDALDEQLRNIFSGWVELLGEPAVRALLGGLDLKKIVRKSTLPHSEIWPDHSWLYLANRFASHELCLIGVLHHVASGVGRRENIETLAGWSFLYIQEAYWEAGYSGQDAGRLELAT